MIPHPSLDISGSLGSELAGKKIVLALSGSVAVVQSVELARLLIRHGAEVFPVMSQQATRLIGPELLEWATGQRPIVELTGKIEHVALVGNVPRPADLLLIAPATANTIGKMAAGIDDTPVTTFFTTAFGEGIPVLVVPAMHLSMYRHPFVKENISKLEKWGVSVVMPRFSEGKAKIDDSETILASVISRLSKRKDFEGKTVLVTAGRTV